VYSTLVRAIKVAIASVCAQLLPPMPKSAPPEEYRLNGDHKSFAVSEIVSEFNASLTLFSNAM
jgi:hypothetical protein